MAYRDEIATLGADHHYPFEDDSLDEIGIVNGTDTSVIYTEAAIALDASNCMSTNAFTDRVTLATTTEINNSAQARKAVGGWYMASVFQAPPIRIYGEGTNLTAFQFCMGFGNNVIFECVEPTNFPTGLQVFGPALVPGRSYHLLGIFLGNAQGDEIKLFVDGVEIFNADPTDRAPGTASLDARGVAEFGDPVGTSGLGGAVVIQQAAINGRYNHWATWGDEADANLTDSEVRTILFEQGALAEETIATGTQGAMQTALDALTVANPNAALNVEVAAVTGGGDFTLTSDLTFDALASCHFRYNGTADTLTIVNVSGGDASIGAAPFGGTLILATRQTLTVTVKDLATDAVIVGARCYIEAAAGGDLAVGTVIMNAVTNSSGVATVTFDFTNSQPIVGRVRRSTSSIRYKTGVIGGPLTSTALNETVLMVTDE